MKQIKVVLDSSIYGEVVVGETAEEFVKLIKKKQNLIIYGNKVIRNELRKTPKDKLIGTKKLRNRLLNLYDYLVENHSIVLNETVEKISIKYTKEYKGNISKDKNQK